ncbi:MAG: phosphotransferase, partial [Anderseniella sp.]
DFPPRADDEDGIALAQRAAHAGAFVTIAHPAWSQLTIEDGNAMMGIAHAVEIYNHGCAVECDRADGFYLMDQLLTSGHRLTSIATDDAHFRDHDNDAFGGWVNVKAENLQPETLLAALKAGDFYASTGPEIHAIYTHKREITIECSPVNAISINGGTSRTVSRTGRGLTHVTLDLAKLDNDWLACPPSKWLRIIVRDAAGKSAWTNPIWLQDEGLALP